MKIVLNGGIYLDTSSTGREPRYTFFTGPMMAFAAYVPVCEHTIEAETDFDDRVARIAAIDAERTEMRVRFADQMRKLDQLRNSLLALEAA